MYKGNFRELATVYLSKITFTTLKFNRFLCKKKNLNCVVESTLCGYVSAITRSTLKRAAPSSRGRSLFVLALANAVAKELPCSYLQYVPATELRNVWWRVYNGRLDHHHLFLMGGAFEVGGHCVQRRLTMLFVGFLAARWR